MGGIFLIQTDGRLVELREEAYDSEAVLQELLARYPDVLAGDQVDPDDPRRWLLVCREAGVPGESDGPDRWSVDHLFLDQDAVPTLVEVKRSTDTRLRREAVGQLLDYAANAVVHWPVDTIRARFEGRCQTDGIEPADELARLLLGDPDADGFWGRVGLNLQAGRIRLVLVADVVPAEVRRVVEFLDGQMAPAEVLAVEVKQYAGEGLRTLVPRVVGRHEASRRRPAGGGAEAKIDEAAFLTEFAQARPAGEVAVARRFVDWARRHGLVMRFHRNTRSVSFVPAVRVGSLMRYPLSVQSGGDVVVQMRHLRHAPPFDDPARREELRMRLEAALGTAVAPERMTGWVCLRTAALAVDAATDRLLAVLDWVVAELRSAGGAEG